jgi:hypothetical protein
MTINIYADIGRYPIYCSIEWHDSVMDKYNKYYIILIIIIILYYIIIIMICIIVIITILYIYMIILFYNNYNTKSLIYDVYNYYIKYNYI